MKSLGFNWMIRHFETHPVFEPEQGGRFQLWPALGAGLIAGVILLIVPRGSPWAGVTFFSSMIMGRPVPPSIMMALPVACFIHLALAEIYALIISAFVNNATQGRAIAIGALIGLVLYLANLAVVSSLFPAWRANEVAVVFTHVVFGLIAGGAYRGLLKRRQVASVQK